MKNKKLIILAIVGGVGTLMTTVSEILSLVIGDKEEEQCLIGGDESAKSEIEVQ